MLAFLAFPFLAGITVWLLNRWTFLRALPLYVSVPLFLSFFIPISIVALVPFDLVDDETLDNHARLIMWRIIYWLSFALMWLVLPVLQSYVESGYHAPGARIKDALKHTLKYQLIVLLAGVFGVLYMGLSTGLSFTSLKALCVALSHSYGLVLVIWLLGHGIVTIPRTVWHSDVDAQLSRLYRRATGIHDAYGDAQANYDDIVAKVMALEPIKTTRYAAWIDELVVDIRSQDLPLSRASASRAQPRDLTPGNVADLSRRLYRDQSRAIRCRADWMRLVEDAQRLEQLKSSDSRYVHTVRPILVRCAAVVLGSLSAVVAWSEVVSGTKLSVVDIVVKRSPPGLRLLVAALFLAYMCVAVNSSLTSMRIFNLYEIVPKHTDASSLLFFAAYALRLTVPLSYNFLILNGTQETVFQDFLGKYINLTPLGKYFNQLLPRLIVIPMILTLFNVYEYIKDYLGFGLGLNYFEDDGDLEGGGAAFTSESEGREFVRRALQGFSPNGARSAGTQSAAANEEGTEASDSLLGKFRSWIGQ